MPSFKCKDIAPRPAAAALAAAVLASVMLTVVLASIFWGSAAASAARADTVVTFPDAKLETALREALGKDGGAISRSDLAELVDFSASGAGISDLTGLEHCAGLAHLDLGSNRISDLAPLAGLVNLTELNLGFNEISDASPISGLPMLSWFWLDHNQIADPGPVPPAADILDLSYNRIRDLSGLSGSGADSLLLAGNQISDIGPLVDDPTISIGSALDLRGNPLDAKSREKHLPALEARGIAVEWDGPPAQPAEEPAATPPAPDPATSPAAVTPEPPSPGAESPSAPETPPAAVTPEPPSPGAESPSVAETPPAAVTPESPSPAAESPSVPAPAENTENAVTGAAPAAPGEGPAGSRVRLWIYLAAGAGGLAALGLLASLGLRLSRPSKPW